MRLAIETFAWTLVTYVIVYAAYDAHFGKHVD